MSRLIELKNERYILLFSELYTGILKYKHYLQLIPHMNRCDKQTHQVLELPSDKHTHKTLETLI